MEEQALSSASPSAAERTKISVPASAACFRGSLNSRSASIGASAHVRPGRDAQRRRRAHWSSVLHDRLWKGWDDPRLWRAAYIEGTATMSLAYLTSLLSGTFGQFGIYAPNWAGITNALVVALFIYGNAVATGGHVNPLISFTTMMTGLTPIPRGVVYILGQTLGGAVAGGLIRGTFGLGKLNVQLHGGGCFFDHEADQNFTRGQAFLIEMMSCYILLQLAYGCALDPRTTQAIGPILGPFFVALASGLITFGTSGLSPHYAGASMNPARCLAFGVASGNYSNQWIYWTGPLAGAILFTATYFVAPVYETKEVDTAPLRVDGSAVVEKT